MMITVNAIAPKGFSIMLRPSLAHLARQSFPAAPTAPDQATPLSAATALRASTTTPPPKPAWLVQRTAPPATQPHASTATLPASPKAAPLAPAQCPTFSTLAPLLLLAWPAPNSKPIAKPAKTPRE